MKLIILLVWLIIMNSADIFLKPTKSINYVTLTFVATRTGVSFEEVTGKFNFIINYIGEFKSKSLKTITQFKSRLAGGGARPNLFEVNINDFNGAPTGIMKPSILMQSNSNVSIFYHPCRIPFRGRILKLLVIEPLILGVLLLLTMKTLNSGLHLNSG